jgi:predicted Zn-dependent protease
MTQQQLFGLGFGIATIASSGFARYGGAAQQALGLLFLKYSRDDENQADQLGVDYATKAGFDPREIPNTYVMLKRVSDQAGQRVPTFMSTHPDPGDRQQRTTALAQAAAAGKTGLIIHNRDYVQRLDGMVFGADPRQGFFEGTRFIQPELKFEITFPSGWKTQNTREAVMAQAADQSAMMQLTLTASKGLSPTAFVQELIRGQQIADAQGSNETIGGHAAWLGRARLIQKDGSAVPIVLGFVQRSGEDMFQVLGQSSGDDGAIAQSIRSLHDLGPIGPITPDRVAVVTVPKTGTFSSVVSSLGPQAISVEATAVLNNVDLDETVAQGTVLKIVKKGSRGH